MSCHLKVFLKFVFVRNTYHFSQVYDLGKRYDFKKVFRIPHVFKEENLFCSEVCDLPLKNSLLIFLQSFNNHVVISIFVLTIHQIDFLRITQYFDSFRKKQGD